MISLRTFFAHNLLPIVKTHELIFFKTRIFNFQKVLSKKWGGLLLLVIIRVSTLLCIVLGAKNVVLSRGKAWGVHGRRFLLRFSNHYPNTHIIMYAIHEQFNQYKANIYKYFKQQDKKKKTIKKLVKQLKF